MAFVEGGSRSYGKEVIMKCTYVMQNCIISHEKAENMKTY